MSNIAIFAVLLPAHYVLALGDALLAPAVFPPPPPFFFIGLHLATSRWRRMELTFPVVSPSVGSRVL